MYEDSVFKVNPISNSEELSPNKEIKNPVKVGDSAPTPFAQFLDGAVNSLESLAKMEGHTNYLTEEYIKGNVSLEEVMFQTNKLSIAMQLAVNVLNTSVQSFKEIQQMQV